MDNALESVNPQSIEENSLQTTENVSMTDLKIELMSNVQVFDNAWTKARILIIRAEEALQKVSSVDVSESMDRFKEFVHNISNVVLKEVETVAQQCIEYANNLMQEEQECSSNEDTETLENQNDSENKETQLVKGLPDIDCFRDDLDLKKHFSILTEAAECTKDTEPLKRSAKKKRMGGTKKVTKAQNVKTSQEIRKAIVENTLVNNSREFFCEICREECGSKAHLEKHFSEKHMSDVCEPIRCMKCTNEYQSRREFAAHLRKDHPELKPNQCGACGKVVKDMKHHMMRVHSKRYKCSVCGHFTARKTSLVVHYRIHTNERPYKCDECDLDFRSVDCLTQHKLNHIDQQVTCDICKKTFKNENSLKAHTKYTHSKDKPLTCDMCFTRFNSPYELKVHSFKHTGISDHKCSICQKYFSVARRLRKHMQNVHQKRRVIEKDRIEQQPIKCVHCFSEFIDRLQFSNHMSSQHTEVPPNQCGACGKVVKDMKHHMLRVHSKRYQCDVCGKIVARKTELVVHKRIHTNDKPFMCEICGKEFRSADQQKAHRETHEPKNLMCAICNKTYKSETSLKAHTKEIHSGERPVVCEICGHGFSSVSKLKAHMFKHTGVSDHYCSLCNKYFALHTKLRMHNDIHHKGQASKYKYLCPICGKYVSMGTKKFHLLSHTGERTLSCKDCGKTFAWPSALREHRKTHLSEPNVQFEFSM